MLLECCRNVCFCCVHFVVVRCFVASSFFVVVVAVIVAVSFGCCVLRSVDFVCLLCVLNSCAYLICFFVVRI